MDKIYILDFDKTLADTAKIMSLVEHVCNLLDIDYDKIRQEQNEIEASGKSYQPMSFINSLGVDRASNFKEEFLRNAPPYQLLYPDGKRLIKRLKNSAKKFLVLTYGPDDWQRLKLKASGLEHVPTIVTSNPNKNRLISEWYKNELLEVKNIGKFTSAVFIDDKPELVRDLPPNVQGIQISRGLDKSTNNIINSLDTLAV